MAWIGGVDHICKKHMMSVDRLIGAMVMRRGTR